MRIGGPIYLGHDRRRGLGSASGTGGAPAVPENIVLTWDGNATDLTPLFTADSVTWEVNDYAEMRWSSSDATLATYTSEQRLITSKTPLTLASDFAYGSGLTAGTWYMQIWNYRGSAYVGKSNIETITLISPAALHTYAGHHMRDAGVTTSSTHSVDFGTISSTKTAVLCINFFQAAAGNTITGVTVDTNGATLVVEHGSFSKTAMYRIDVTSGGTKSIVVTSSGNIYNIDVAVHILSGVNATPVGTDKDGTGYGTTKVLFSGASGNGTGTQDIPTGGVMILSAASQYNNAFTFPAATTDVDTWSGGSGTIQSASGHHYGSNLNPTVTAAVNTEFAACGAIWGP